MIELSIIIPTRNRPDLLRGALSSLVCQTVNQSCFEVLVVDNGPSPRTAEVVADFYDSIANLRYLEESSPGLHNARHRGMREAKAELLVYADDDIEAFPEWIEGVWHGFTRHEAALVGGRNLPKWETEPPAWLAQLWNGSREDKRSLGFLSILDFGNVEKEIDPCYVWGCNFSVRKSVLLEAGGFHPDSMPDDLLHLRGDGESHVASFIAAKGYRSAYIPSASVYHLVSKERMTFAYFRKRAFSQGVSDSYQRLRKNPYATGDISMNGHPLAEFLEMPLFRHLLYALLPAGIVLEANVDQAYREGFNWHLQQFLSDDEVRKWVLRENYLGCR